MFEVPLPQSNGCRVRRLCMFSTEWRVPRSEKLGTLNLCYSMESTSPAKTLQPQIIDEADCPTLDLNGADQELSRQLTRALALSLGGSLTNTGPGVSFVGIGCCTASRSVRTFVKFRYGVS